MSKENKKKPVVATIQAAETINSAKSKLLNFFSNYALVQILVAVLGIGIYLNSVPNEWAIDDSMVITGNKFTQRGVAGIDSLARFDTFYGFFDGTKAMVAGGRWRPLTPVMFAFEAQLFAPNRKDEAGNPLKDKAGYTVKDFSPENMYVHVSHAVNVLLYGLLCFALYRLFLMLLNPQKDKDNTKGNVVAGIAALLFAVHPLHTEAVANIKGRDEIVALLGCVAATYWLLKSWYNTQNADGKKATIYTVLAAAAYMISLLSKESGVTYLAVVPLVFWFFTQADMKTIAVKTVPLLVVFVVFLGMRYSAIGNQKLAGFETKELINDPFLTINEKTTFKPLVDGARAKVIVNPNQETYIKMPYSEQLATIVYTAGVYLKLLVVPHPLTNDYYPRHIEKMSFGDAAVWLSLLVNGFLLFWAVKHTREKNPIAFGILYYFATFSIVSNLFFPIGTNMSERFMFMPSVGFCLSMALLLYSWGEKTAKKSGASGFNLPIAAVVAIAAIFSILTLMRNPVWKNDFTLCLNDINISKNSAKLNHSVGAMTIDMANTDELKELKNSSTQPEAQQKTATEQARKHRDEKIQNGLTYLEKALEIHPGYAEAWHRFGNGYYLLAQSGGTKTLQYFRTAIAAYEQVKLLTGQDYMKTNIGVAYRDMGKFCKDKIENHNLAVEYLQKSLTYNEDPEAYHLLGTTYLLLKQGDKAAENLEKSLAIRPGDVRTMENLSVAYQLIGNAQGNKSLLEKAETMLLDVYKADLAIPADNPKRTKSILRTLFLLQQNYGLMGNTAKKAEYRAEILKLEPGYVF